jgi:hypothetical protein
MATTTSITTSYAGESASKYISAALLSASTIENGGVEVKPNIKYKEVIKKLATGDLLADGSCDFTATSSVTLTERILTPKELQVNLQLCKSDFRSDWDAISMGYSAFDSLPPSFADYLIAHVAAKVAEKNEQNIWAGDDSNSGEFDGFLTLAAADGDVVDVAGASGGVTASNVIAELGKVRDAIPNSIYSKEDLSIYVAPNVAKAYIAAQAALGYANLYHDGRTNLNFEGIKLFVCDGMTASYMVAAQKSNLYFGTGLLSDHNEVKVIDLADLDGSQNVRIVMRLTAGVQYGIGSEVILYTPGA